MKKCNNCNNHKNQQHRNPQQQKQLPIKDAFPLPFPAKIEIQMPSKEDFVKIPVGEYADLVAVSATMDAIVRWVESDHSTYIDFETLRALLGIPKEDAK